MVIACPKCDFCPRPNLLWICRPGCATKWHTFATHGICPGCHKFWHDTCCPRCKMWSPHDDWYRDLNGAPDREITIERRLPGRQEAPSAQI
jgi:hypothetical protein